MSYALRHQPGWPPYSENVYPGRHDPRMDRNGWGVDDSLFRSRSCDSGDIAEFGIGLVAAVALDAFLLRIILVPALMHRFGPDNWWLPRRP
jgi:hypothetical protein